MGRCALKKNDIVPLSPLASAVVWACLIFPVVFSSGDSNPLLLPAIVIATIAFALKLLQEYRCDGVVLKYAAAMFVLALIQLIGCFFVQDILSIRYVFYIVAITLFSCCFITNSLKPSANLIAGIGAIAILIRFIMYLFDNTTLESKNTLPGILVFVIAYMVFCHFRDCEEHGVGLGHYRIRIAVLLVSIILAIIMIDITKSRTALIVFAIIVILYLALAMTKPSSKTLKIMFFALVILLCVGLYVYVNAKNFGWYDFLNNYSVRLFGKNIDSSRPALWAEALSSLDSHFILGLGTGAQPGGSFAGKSFHNTFLQLLVQNGIVGLVVFVATLGFLWMQISKNACSQTTFFSIAVFIGIIIYNCFECTLLCNKLALGFIEWLLIASASYSPTEQRERPKGLACRN